MNQNKWKESPLVVSARVFHSTSPWDVEAKSRSLYRIGTMGVIEEIIGEEDILFEPLSDAMKGMPNYRVVPENQWLIPGFVDTHFHAPQWLQAGLALDKSLESWLHDYTFPLEASYVDTSWVERVYEKLVSTLLRHGTVTAQYFGTVEYEPNAALLELAGRLGQRALVGKVAMDEENQCPAYYKDNSVESAVKDTERLLLLGERLSRSYQQGVHGVVTPRFIPTCSDALLRELGALAKHHDAYIQTHISESDWEHNYVKERMGMCDAEALDKFSLLTKKSTLAHGVFLSDADMALVSERGSTISHCPLSNVFFANAVFPLKRALSQDVSVSLASDISGGFSLSMFDAMRQSIISARMLDSGVNPKIPQESRGVRFSEIDYKTAFYMATLGGAKSLGIPSGRFEVGCYFDAVQFDPNSEGSQIPTYSFGVERKLDELQQTVFLGSVNNIVTVYVQGREVYKYA